MEDGSESYSSLADSASNASGLKSVSSEDIDASVTPSSASRLTPAISKKKEI